MIVYSIGLHKLERATSFHIAIANVNTRFNNELFFSSTNFPHVFFRSSFIVSWTHTFYQLNCTHTYTLTVPMQNTDGVVCSISNLLKINTVFHHHHHWPFSGMLQSNELHVQTWTTNIGLDWIFNKVDR